MKSKIEMAHDYAMLHMMMDRYKDVDDLEMVQWANDYVDALEADANKREKAEAEIKRAEMRKLLNADNTFVEKEGQHFDDVNFEPDWSQAPEWAVAWTKDSGETLWWSYIPWFKNNFWFVDDSIIWQCGEAPSFGYQGDWRESLRKRP